MTNKSVRPYWEDDDSAARQPSVFHPVAAAHHGVDEAATMILPAFLEERRMAHLPGELRQRWLAAKDALNAANDRLAELGDALEQHYCQEHVRPTPPVKNEQRTNAANERLDDNRSGRHRPRPRSQ